MREIKFRAWNGKEMKEVQQMDWFDGIHVSYDWHDGLHQIPKTFELMQYTGLKDKNGVSIYEGDILQTTRIKDDGSSKKYLVSIEWSNKMLSLRVKLPAPKYYPNGRLKMAFKAMNWLRSHTEQIGASEVEIIGNIYENPDLILL